SAGRGTVRRARGEDRGSADHERAVPARSAGDWVCRDRDDEPGGAVGRPGAADSGSAADAAAGRTVLPPRPGGLRRGDAGRRAGRDRQARRRFVRRRSAGGRGRRRRGDSDSAGVADLRVDRRRRETDRDRRAAGFAGFESMTFDVVTIFPAMIEAALAAGIVGRAIERGVLDVAVRDLRDFTTDRHRVVDDVPYGGGPGMVLKPDPIFRALDAIEAARGRPLTVVLTSP